MKEARLKATYCIILFIWNAQNRQIHKNRKFTCCQGVGRRGFPFGVIKCSGISGSDCTTLWLYQKHWIVHFKDGFTTMWILSQKLLTFQWQILFRILQSLKIFYRVLISVSPFLYKWKRMFIYQGLITFEIKTKNNQRKLS